MARYAGGGKNTVESCRSIDVLNWKRYCLTRADSPHQSLQISNRTKSLGLQMANPRGQLRDKPFRDALRMEIADAGEDHKALRRVARALLKAAEAARLSSPFGKWCERLGRQGRASLGGG